MEEPNNIPEVELVKTTQYQLVPGRMYEIHTHTPSEKDTSNEDVLIFCGIFSTIEERKYDKAYIFTYPLGFRFGTLKISRKNFWKYLIFEIKIP